MSSVLNTLERDGLVRRRRQSADGRVVTVTVTAQGRQRVKKAFALQHAREHQWLGDLDRQTVAALVETPAPSARNPEAGRAGRPGGFARTALIGMPHRGPGPD